MIFSQLKKKKYIFILVSIFNNENVPITEMDNIHSL